MFCPNCGANLKDGAKFCTSCGQPLNTVTEQPVPPQPPQQPQQTWQQPQQQWQPQPQQQWQPQQPQQQQWQPQSQPQPEPQSWQQPQQQWQQQQWQQPQQQWQPQQQQQAWQQPVPPVKTVNKGKRLAAILIPVGALAVIAALVAVFFTPISNFFRRTVSSPESYYQYVEKRSSERIAEDVGDYYEAFVPEAEDLKNRSVEAELSLTMGDAARELLSESADMDMSWFKDVSVHVSANGNETLGSANVDLNLNGTKVISADGVVDLDAAEAYIRIPLFSDDYLRMTVEELKESLPDGLDLGGLDLDDLELGNLDLSDLLDMDLESIPLQQLVDAMPKDTEVRELLSKYYKLISDQIENVEKGEQTIEAEGVSQKCTALTATIDGATAKKIVTAVCNELLQDKQVKQIVVRLGSAVAEASGEDASEYGEEAYQELMDKVRDTLENVDELSEGMEEIQHIVFVNKAGETVGRVITASGGVFEYLRPEDGEKYGLRLHFTSEETELTVSGSGVERGGKSSGSFVVELSDEEFGRLEVSNFDKDALKDGNLKGSFAFFPSAKLLQDSSLPVSLPDFGIQLDADCGKDKADVSVTLLQNKNVYLSVAMKILLGHETASTKLPASAKDAEQWAESVDSEQALESLVNALKKAGMPEELLGSLLSMASGGGTDYYD